MDMQDKTKQQLTITALVGVLGFYPIYELSRLILSYLQDPACIDYVYKPFTLAHLFQDLPWSPLCFVGELIYIWSVYIIILVIVWRNVACPTEKKQT